MNKILNGPVVFFFVLGFLVFGLHAFLNVDPAPDDAALVVEVTSADIEWLRSSWESRMQRKPTPAELSGLIDNFIREEILSREARIMGLDSDDRVIKRRLVQRLEYVLEDLTQSVEPTQDELVAYAEQNREKYQIPATVSFTHIFFNPDRRDHAESDARELLARLRSNAGSLEAFRDQGDPIMLDTDYSGMTPEDLARTFGAAFAGQVGQGTDLGWLEPVASAFGLHLVYVHARTPSQAPEFEAIRDQVLADVLYQRKQTVRDGTFESVRERYTVLVEGLPHE